LGGDEFCVVDHSVVVDVVGLEDRVDESGQLAVFVVRRKLVVVAIVTVAI
jgi:hypothetical protein